MTDKASTQVSLRSPNAAIDRLVHHSTILELNAPSYRTEQAKQKVSAKQITTTNNKKKEEIMTEI